MPRGNSPMRGVVSGRTSPLPCAHMANYPCRRLTLAHPGTKATRVGRFVNRSEVRGGFMRLTRWLLAVVPLLTLCCVRANAAPCTKSGFSDQLFVIVSAPASPAGTFCVQINEPAPNNPEGNVSMVVDLGEAFKPNGVGVATIFEATPGCVSTGVSSDVVRLNIAADGHTATITYSSD